MFKQIHWLLDTKNRAPNKDSQEKELFSSRKANNLRNALSSGTFNDTDVVKNTFLEKKLGEFDEYISKIDIRLNIFHTSERLKLKG